MPHQYQTILLVLKLLFEKNDLSIVLIIPRGKWGLDCFKKHQPQPNKTRLTDSGFTLQNQLNATFLLFLGSLEGSAPEFAIFRPSGKFDGNHRNIQYTHIHIILEDGGELVHLDNHFGVVGFLVELWNPHWRGTSVVTMSSYPYYYSAPPWEYPKGALEMLMCYWQQVFSLAIAIYLYV